jgi:hypothetical protein
MSVATSRSLPSSFLDAFVAPGDFFANFSQVRRFGPVVLIGLLALIVGAHHFFYSSMDEAWLLEQQLEMVTGLSMAEQEVARNALRNHLSSAGMLAGALTAIGLLLQVIVLSAFYLFGVRLLCPDGDRMDFNSWFSLVAWCQLPWFVNYAVFTLLFLSSSSTDLPLSLPQFASVGQVFMTGLSGSEYAQWAQSLNLFYAWVIFMTAAALRQHLTVPLRQALVFAAAPYLLFFGGWLVLLLCT